MTKLKYLIFLVALSLNAEIIQTNRMEEILPHINETTWVLFDIDNTLLEPSTQAGREQWFHHEVKQIMATQELDRLAAEELLYPDWVSFMEICPVRTPELGTLNLLKVVQEKGGASLAITSRHPPLLKLTLKQLDTLKIDFSNHAPPSVSLDTLHPTHWEKGILFLSWSNSKGETFRQFIEKSDVKPRKIVFIDDTRRHLESMENELQKSGIEFVGFHYTKTSERPFDPEVASKEYREILKQSRNL